MPRNYLKELASRLYSLYVEDVEKYRWSENMDKKITSFSVDWHDCGLCNPLDKVHERTTIYLRKI